MISWLWYMSTKWKVLNLVTICSNSNFREHCHYSYHNVLGPLDKNNASTLSILHPLLPIPLVTPSVIFFILVSLYLFCTFFLYWCYFLFFNLFYKFIIFFYFNYLFLLLIFFSFYFPIQFVPLYILDSF